MRWSSLGWWLGALAVVWLASGVSAHTQPACLPGAARYDCGYGDEQTCTTNNCCWNPVTSDLTANMTEDELANPPQQLLSGTPWCYAKQTLDFGYQVTEVTQSARGVSLLLSLYDGSAYFGQDIETIQVDVTMETVQRLRVKVYDPNNTRWEIPDSILPLAPVNATLNIDDVNYAFSWTSQPFGFAVTRLADQEVLFNSTVPRVQLDGAPLFNGLIFTDQYIEISTVLPSQPHMYGLGEKVTSLHLETQGNPITFWARDAATPVDQNIYGSHPVYFENRQTTSNGSLSTKTHGVWLRNSNGMDVVIHDGDSARRQQLLNGVHPRAATEGEDGFLTYRVIGGVLDFFIYVGSEGVASQPEAIVREYHQSVGFPHMPPFWSLGWHQCRWGYTNLQAVETMVQKYAAANIPLDTAWTDIDYMGSLEDFSTDPVNFPTAAMGAFIKQLHSQGQHYVLIVDPAIHNRTGYATFDDGLAQGVFIRQSNGELFVGKVWPGTTAFPSFYTPATQDWWTKNIATFRAGVPIDGMWIDMNEASNFCSGDCDNPTSAAMQMKGPRHHDRAIELMSTSSSTRHDRRSSAFQPNSPPYRINNAAQGLPLNTKTIDADAIHGAGFIEYNVHNMYGFSESIATRKALESTMQSRSFVLSRSTFSGSGAVTGHWLGDNWSTFPSMSYSIPGILAMNMFGVTLVGADICGFNGNTNEELCARWQALGAFYPFARNHNSKGQISQEPYTWPSVAAVTQVTLAARYSLLHVYNTLFFLANAQGGTVVRPLFFQWANDPATFTVDTQFLLGSSIMITPVLTAGVTEVTGYFPPMQNDGTPQTYFDWWTREPLTVPANGVVTLAAPTSTIPVHIVGGTILPLQQPGLNTAAQAANPFTFVVAPSAANTATGMLFMDDGLTLSVGTDSLQATIDWSSDSQLEYSILTSAGYVASEPQLTEIQVLGVTSQPTDVLVQGQSAAFTLNATSAVLSVQVNLSLLADFTMAVQY